MRYALVNLALVASTAYALPNNIMIHGKNRTRDVHEPKPALCLPSLGLIHTRPKCCKGDILGFSHHGCGAPDPFPSNVTAFVNGCLENGKAAECCLGTVRGIGFLCHTPTLKGSVGALESINGTTVTILEIAQSDDNDTATPSVVRVTKKLSEDELAMLAGNLVSTVKAVEENEDGETTLKIKVPTEEGEAEEVDVVARAVEELEAEEEEDEEEEDYDVGSVTIEASPSSTKNPMTA